MIKINKKGFTMVELLAAIVILGILLAFAGNSMVRLLTKSREKVYIREGAKLASQAEYIVKSKPNIIEKPTAGNCIVIFLSYLNSDDYADPPNGGTYAEDKSFAVYKKLASGATGPYDYEISAVLIENLKTGGYRGVKLTNSLALSKGNGDIVSGSSAIVSATTASVLKTYINNNLGTNYCSSVTEIYK